MKNFGILISNYKDPIVETPQDVFKRFMFTSCIFLKRDKMKGRQTKVTRRKEIENTAHKTQK